MPENEGYEGPLAEFVALRQEIDDFRRAQLQILAVQRQHLGTVACPADQFVPAVRPIRGPAPRHSRQRALHPRRAKSTRPRRTGVGSVETRSGDTASRFAAATAAMAFDNSTTAWIPRFGHLGAGMVVRFAFPFAARPADRRQSRSRGRLAYRRRVYCRLIVVAHPDGPQGGIDHQP